jgi:two-component system, NtrC family, response regulator AtoC
MAAAQLLLVEDDNAMREMLESLFRQEGYVVSEAASASAALALARETDFDVVLSDIKMPGKSGLELVGELRELRPDMPVVLMTAFGSIDTAVDAMRAGAFGYTTKPFQPEEVIRTVKRALDRRSVEDGNRKLRGSAANASFKELIGDSPSMRTVFSIIRRAAQVDASVLITGESGTGKEVVARTLHHHGRRAQKPFLPINCTAVPEGLLESELFGHVRGAFTGAVANKRGLFERADGGTLFLDEIGDMGAGLQAKLLRVLQDHEVRPVGSTQAVKVDVRIIAATNRNLDVEMEAGRFRDDLYYRLNVIPIHLPPLRERPEDVPSLVEAFVRKHSGDRARRFSRDAIVRLQSHVWRGNARELENLVERTLALSDADLLNVSDLPLDSLSDEPIADPRDANSGVGLVQALADAARNGLTLRALEDLYIEQMLVVTGGKKGEAARMLGIDRKTLYRRDPTH